MGAVVERVDGALAGVVRAVVFAVELGALVTVVLATIGLLVCVVVASWIVYGFRRVARWAER